MCPNDRRSQERHVRVQLPEDAENHAYPRMPDGRHPQEIQLQQDGVLITIARLLRLRCQSMGYGSNFRDGFCSGLVGRKVSHHLDHSLTVVCNRAVHLHVNGRPVATGESGVHSLSKGVHVLTHMINGLLVGAARLELAIPCTQSTCHSH